MWRRHKANDMLAIGGALKIQHSRTLIIGGVTASGKSDLAIGIAKEIDGVIVNADSIQLYRDIPTLTARPKSYDCAQITHQLYGVLEAHQSSSVARWADMAQAQLDEIVRSGRTAIFVGGTGLYLSALTKGIAAVPEIDMQVRERVRAMSTIEVNALLQNHDEQSHQALEMGDTQRRCRALEVAISTGRPLSEWQRQPHTPIVPGAVSIALLPPRAHVRENVRARLSKMIECGVVDEVAELRHRVGNPLELPIGKTLGLAELLQFIDDKISLDEAIEKIAVRTGQYVKRQETWFRRQWPETQSIDAFGQSTEAMSVLRSRWNDAAC